MTDEKQPVEKAVELFVYAPVGMALYVRDMLPSMMGIFVARGKREVSQHRTPPPPVSPPPIPPEVKRRIDESVGLARVMAGSGLGVARGVSRSGLGVARDVAGGALSQLGALRGNAAGNTVSAPSPVAPASPVPTPAPPVSTPVPPTPSAPSAPSAPSVPPDAAWRADVNGDTDVSDASDADALPIPDYDELSASQVVERLDGLDVESLEAIRRYESQHRGRNTILGKISQLT